MYIYGSFLTIKHDKIVLRWCQKDVRTWQTPRVSPWNQLSLINSHLSYLIHVWTWLIYITFIFLHCLISARCTSIHPSSEYFSSNLFPLMEVAIKHSTFECFICQKLNLRFPSESSHCSRPAVNPSKFTLKLKYTIYRITSYCKSSLLKYLSFRNTSHFRLAMSVFSLFEVRNSQPSAANTNSSTSSGFFVCACQTT